MSRPHNLQSDFTKQNKIKVSDVDKLRVQKKRDDDGDEKKLKKKVKVSKDKENC